MIEKKVYWNYPIKPSQVQRKFFSKLVDLCRQEYNIVHGPALEYRVGEKFWIDVCFLFPENDIKIGIEVDGSCHNDRKPYDEKRDDYLRSLGFKIMRVPVELIDIDCDFMARCTLDEVIKIANYKLAN